MRRWLFVRWRAKSIASGHPILAILHSSSSAFTTLNRSTPLELESTGGPYVLLMGIRLFGFGLDRMRRMTH
jgi:hypothetical protein